MVRPDRSLVVEAGLTVVLGGVFLASTVGATDARELDGLGWALLAANVLPLLALRRAPLLVVACFSVAYPAWAALDYPTDLLQSLPTLTAMFAVGAAPRPLWWRALALLTPAEMLAAAASGIWPVDLLEIGYVAIMFVSGWGLGVVLAARRGYTSALEEKTAALEAARQELAHRAVLEERTRIARDLHDILAHAMSVITVQAGVGAHLLERDPEQARGALRVIEETGRGALGEMRRLLGALRGGDPPTEPQPGLASLDRLVSQASAAGVPVELQVEGPARPLPAGLEVSAYRIAQEALTNTIKHAPGGRARLTVRYRPHTVEVEVVNEGGAAKSVEPPSAAIGPFRPAESPVGPVGPGPAGDAGAGRPLRRRVRGRAPPRRLPGAGRVPHRSAMTAPPEPVRVLVVDDQELVRAGFVALLASDDGIEVVGQAADGAEAVALARRTSPQVALMDIRMPVLDGIAATRELRALPDPLEVVILTTFDTDEYAYQAFRAGACGFLVKDTPPVELLRAVHQTAAGGTVISPATARRLVRDLAASRPDRRPTPAALQRLTERELEVLRLLARGHSNREIARELVISDLTAKTHVSRILTKLDLATRVHAVVFAYETGLVTPGTDP